MRAHRRLTLLVLSSALVAGALIRSAANATPTSASEVRTLDSIVAIVGDDIVTSSEVERRSAPLVAALPKSLEGAARDGALQQIRDQMLDRILDEHAIQRESEELGITVTTDEIDRAVDSLAEAQHLGRAELERAVADAGMTPEAYRAELERQLVEAKVIRAQVIPTLAPGLSGEALNAALERARPAFLSGLRAKIYIEKRPS
ncbi:MAG: SurA N-terminal domain-containing protein [Polyangiaceae bacterium]